MRVVISGASGLIGTALSNSLRADGHTVIALVRREARTADESSWSPSEHRIDQDVIASADAIVNLAGASIGAKRLTSTYKHEVLQSRVDSTTTIARAIAAAGTTPRLLQGSSMGFYGARGDEELTESSDRGDGFLADVCVAWEHAADLAVDTGARVAYLRSGLVLAAHGGFAERLLPLVRRGLFGGFGKGNAYQAWITLDDEVRAVQFLLENDHEGPVNMVAPEAVVDAELVAALARAFGKSPGFKVPEWILHAVVGEAVDDLLASQKGIPGVLTRLGFEWRHATVDSAARYVASAA